MRYTIAVMKSHQRICTSFVLFLCVLCIFTTVCTSCRSVPPQARQSDSRIYLYGETHGQPHILQQELALWQQYYHEQGFRHLFIEVSYFMAQYLNLWMQSDSDDYLYYIYDCIDGTQTHVPAFLDFYKAIKETCPETVFHGTDVGHQYWSMGDAYIEYLDALGLRDSEEWNAFAENYTQGWNFYNEGEQYDVFAYRETCMVQNFIRAFDALPADEKIMGIYGSQHTIRNGRAWNSDSEPNMITQLRTYYADRYDWDIYADSLK